MKPVVVMRARGASSPTPPPTVTWNPADKHLQILLSDANLTATAGTDNRGQSVRATLSHSSGKRYFEIFCEKIDVSPYIQIGVAKASHTLAGWVGTTADGWGYYQETGAKANGPGSSYGPSYTTGDTIGVAVDFGTGEITFYKNGTSLGVAFSNVVGAIFPMVTLYRADAPAHKIRGRFRSTDFVHTPPSGFLPWGG